MIKIKRILMKNQLIKFQNKEMNQYNRIKILVIIKKINLINLNKQFKRSLF